MKRSLQPHAMAFCLFVMAAGIAHAQEARSLEIRDGDVYVDGRLVSLDEVPETLNTTGIRLQVHFAGDVRPVVEIDDRLFVLDGDVLREAAAGDLAPEPFHLRAAFAGRDAAGRFAVRNRPIDRSVFAAPHALAMEETARELQDHARRFENLQLRPRGQFGARHLQELQQAARALQTHAREAARMAAEMPRMEVRNYLEDVQRMDRDLFERLLNEQMREAESYRLSHEIAAMPEGAERERRIVELRETLAEIFELKQANRRREARQLESRLDDLQQRLHEREQLRDEIIERRLRQLLQDEDSPDW